MSAAARLGAYGAGLLLAFGGAFVIAGAVAPEAPVVGSVRDDHGADAEAAPSNEQEIDTSGVAIARSGYTIGPISAPSSAGERDELSFQILDAAGDPVTAFETAHGKQLHLIAVRTDGAGYRHAHPELDSTTGTWSLPWAWDAAGSYRVYADFTSADAADVTLSRIVDVAGELEPRPATAVSTSDSVDGFDVTIGGELTAGRASELTVEVARDGGPVTELEPYLGAFGHLVALRQGDLAYLHARGDEPQPDSLAGPAVVFSAEAPTAGRYLLYLDFQVDGEVHTAEFVLDARPPMGDEGGTGEPDRGGSGHDGTGRDGH